MSTPAAAASAQGAGRPGPRAPVNATTRPLLRRLLVGTALLICFAIAGLLLSTAIRLEVGVQAALLGVIFAALPLGIVVPAFLWLDRVEDAIAHAIDGAVPKAA